MKRAIENTLLLLVAVLVGALGMYAYNYYYPNVIETSKVEKNVTITDTGISEGIDKIYDAVVVVENYSKSRLAGIGSGFIYDANGYIMTNHHVIANASSVKVKLMSGETVSASVIGSDEYADIAVIQIPKEYVKKVAIIGKSEDTKIGDTVFTIGSPMSSSYFGTVTRGILSGKNRMVEVAVDSSSNDWIMNVMQTDAAINPGNSGGPLCNVNGEVIGINSMKIVEDEIEGIGFAIPIEDAVEYASKVISGEKVSRSYLGITMAEVSTPQYYLSRYGITINSSIVSGVIIMSVEQNSPSSKAGILKGDVITKIGGYDVKNVAELRYYLYKHKPNEKVKITITRGTDTKTFDVTLGESK